MSGMQDSEGARVNALVSIAVTYGYGSETELRNARPDYLVHSVAELRSLLKALLGSGHDRIPVLT